MRVKSIATEASEVQAILATVPRARPPPPLCDSLSSTSPPLEDGHCTLASAGVGWSWDAAA